MTTLKTKLTVAAASILALAATAQADVPLASNITASGFVLASFQNQNPGATDRLNMDDAMIKLTGDYKPVKGVVSLYYVPGSSIPGAGGSSTGDIHLLDAYATYDAGGGFTVTAGRFLSWMGYESFFPVNNPEITGAYNLEGNIISGYEDGARVEYTDKDWAAGFALVDSTFEGNTVNAPYAGDGELKHNYGLEGYFSYTGVKDLQVWLGAAYDSKDTATSLTVPGAAKGLGFTPAQTTLDLWSQYQIDKNTYVAAELAYHDYYAAKGANSTSWLVLCDYTFTDAVSAAFRVGGDKTSSTLKAAGVLDDIKYTFAPTYVVSKNFSVRAELSYTAIPGPTANTTFYGLQGVFKF